MINVQIDKTDLLDLCMDRLGYWITDDDKLALYRDYLEELINEGCFESVSLDVKEIIDNLYINDTTIMNKEELEDNNIDIDDSEKVLAKNEDEYLYLVRAY